MTAEFCRILSNDSRRRSNWNCTVDTVYSMDGLIDFYRLIKTASCMGLDAIAITDHDTIEGAKIREAIKARNRIFQIIVGEEKTLEDGSQILILLFWRWIV